jgi:hypothetical protein
VAAAAIAPCKPAARRRSSGVKKWKPAEKVTDDEIKVLMKLMRSFKK